MPKLSEIVGGLLKDVAQACATSDFMSVELYDSYQTMHPLLMKFPVPRVTVKEVSLKLKFALQELGQVTYDVADLTDIVHIWNTHLVTQTLPQVYTKALNKRELDPATAQLLREAARATDVPQFSLAEALQGSTKQFLDQAVEYVVAVKGNLPKDLAKQVPTLAELRKLARPIVERDVAHALPSMRRTAVAKMAMDTDLDVTVRQADLEKMRESDVQELDLTLVMDSIQMLDTTNERGTEVSSEE